MPPKRKKAKTDAADTSAEAIASESLTTGRSVEDIQKQHDLVYKQLSTTLNSLGSAKDSKPLLKESSLSFLQLKALQRELLQQVNQTTSLLQQQAKRRQTQELQLENLKAEQACFQQDIVKSKDISLPQLEQFCQGELGDNKKSKDPIADFFGGKLDPQNADHRASILERLNQEVSTKTKLSTQLKQSQLHVASTKQSLASKKKLLQELPLKLQEMERASMPLQKFCQQHLGASQKIGSKRNERLNASKSLSKPLYTLFHQLQATLDTLISSTSSSDDAGASVPRLDIPSGSGSVVLKFPIPSVSDGSASYSSKSKKSAVVSFHHYENPGVVSASVSTDHDMSNLLDELFPGDTGEWTAEPLPSGKPYCWCNYLAGLHLAPQDQDMAKQRLSTRVVLQTLQRRVRALATLHYLLPTLSRKTFPIPVHALFKEKLGIDSSTSSVRIATWSLETLTAGSVTGTNNNSSIRNYKVVLKHKSKMIPMTVSVNMGRYPAIPPEWKLDGVHPGGGDNNDQSDLNEAHLYDKSLAELQRKANDDLDKLVQEESSSDESTYDWILSHQLVRLMKGWEEMLAKE